RTARRGDRRALAALDDRRLPGPARTPRRVAGRDRLSGLLTRTRRRDDRRAAGGARMNFTNASVRLAEERDVVLARQRARTLAALLGFDTQDQVRIATAVSETARCALGHAPGGRVEWSLEHGEHGQALCVLVRDGAPPVESNGSGAGHGGVEAALAARA